MNDFEFYLEEGDVKKRKTDVELAKSLLKDAMVRFEKVSRLDVDEFAKIIFENIYDAIRDVLDALLALDGYKSYSHEASIAYLKKYGLSPLIPEMDSFRALRNSSKYYGKDILPDSTRDIKEFYTSNVNKIINITEEKLDECAKK